MYALVEQYSYVLLTSEMGHVKFHFLAVNNGISQIHRYCPHGKKFAQPSRYFLISSYNAFGELRDLNASIKYNTILAQINFMNFK